MPKYRMRFGRKDALLKNLLFAPAEVPISNIVELAIEYYAKFGTYVSVGTVTTDEMEEDKNGKTIYISQGSAAEEYIRRQQEKGISVQKVIFGILKKSLSIGEENRTISKADYWVYWHKMNSGRMMDDLPAAPLKTAEEAVTETASSIPDKEPKTVVEKSVPDNEPQAGSKEKKKITFADQFIFYGNQK